MDSGDKVRLIALDVDGVLNGSAFFEERYNTKRMQEKMSARYNNHGFDGVYEIDPAAVALLNELVSRTQAWLVLSSTWRLGSRGPDRLDGLDYTKNALAFHGFEHNDRFLGKTPGLYGDDGSGGWLVRGHEIQSFMDSCGWTIGSLCILDDDADMAHLLPRLVHTPNWTGLTPWKCEEAEKMLLTPLEPK